MNIAVVGGSICSKSQAKLAYQLGQLIVKQNWIVICGGGSGIMEAVSWGAYEAGGIVVGILPESDKQKANKYLTVALPTGLGYARNILVVRSADVIVAFAGKYGTLSEIAFALNEGKKVIGIGTWQIPGIIKAKTAQEVIKKIKAIKQRKNKGGK